MVNLYNHYYTSVIYTISNDRIVDMGVKAYDIL